MSCKTCTTVAALISILLQDAANDGCNSCASLARLVLSFIAAAKSSSSVAAIILSFIKVYRKFHCMFYCSCDPSISTDNLPDCSCVLYYIRPIYVQCTNSLSQSFSTFLSRGPHAICQAPHRPVAPNLPCLSIESEKVPPVGSVAEPQPQTIVDILCAILCDSARFSAFWMLTVRDNNTKIQW